MWGGAGRCTWEVHMGGAHGRCQSKRHGESCTVFGAEVARFLIAPGQHFMMTRGHQLHFTPSHWLLVTRGHSGLLTRAALGLYPRPRSAGSAARAQEHAEAPRGSSTAPAVRSGAGTADAGPGRRQCLLPGFSARCRRFSASIQQENGDQPCNRPTGIPPSLAMRFVARGVQK
jgi:hypothetical protein